MSLNRRYRRCCLINCFSVVFQDKVDTHQQNANNEFRLHVDSVGLVQLLCVWVLWIQSYLWWCVTSRSDHSDKGDAETTGRFLLSLQSINFTAGVSLITSADKKMKLTGHWAKSWLPLTSLNYGKWTDAAVCKSRDSEDLSAITTFWLLFEGTISDHVPVWIMLNISTAQFM